jgi:hypothetical protein
MLFDDAGITMEVLERYSELFASKMNALLQSITIQAKIVED